jgi:hypothetical protein
MTLFPTDDAWDQFAQERLRSPDGAPSSLPHHIASGEFSNTELNEIIARSIRDPSLGYAVLGNDSPGLMFPEDSSNSSGTSAGDRIISDQSIIAPALDRAFRDGAIGVDDLKTLGEEYGQERVAALLGRSATGAGGAAEAYAMALLEPHRPLPTDNKPPLPTDRNFVAAPTDPETLRTQGLAFSLLANDPDLREKHFSEAGGIPPRYAFETLGNYNDKHPYNPNDPALVSDQSAQGLKAAANLYGAHHEELLDHYTGANGQSQKDMPELSRFWAQTSINPYARDIEVPVPPPGSGTQPLYEAVNGTTHKYVDGLIDTVKKAPSDGNLQQDTVAQLGALDAGMHVAIDLELSRYQGSIKEQERIAGWFAETGGQLAGTIPGAKLPIVGDALERGGKSAGDHLGSWVGSWLGGEPPVAPDVGNGDVTGDLYSRIGRAELDRADADLPNRPNLQEDFEQKSGEVTDNILRDLTRRSGEPVNPVFSTPRPDGEQHSSLLSSPGHPDYARYATCLDACTAGNLGLDRDQLSNVAATVAARSRAEGLPTLDHVVASPRGDTVFAVAGRLDDPAHQRIAVSVDEARVRSVEASSRDWASANQNNAVELASQDVTRTERASRAV